MMKFDDLFTFAEELATFADIEAIEIKDDCLVVPFRFFQNVLEFVRDNEISNVKLSIKGSQIKLTLS